MKKIKNNRKILGIALALSVLMSVFTLCASAAVNYEDSGLCDCIMSQSFLYTRQDVEKIQDSGNGVSLTCADCHKEYDVVTSDGLSQYLSYSAEWDTIKFSFHVGETGTLFLRGHMFNGYKTVNVTSVEVNDVAAPGIEIENACDCIWLESIRVSYEDMAQYKANNAPIVCHCPQCLTEYSFTIDWTDFPTNTCDGYDLMLENYEDGSNLVIGIVENREEVRTLNSPLQSITAAKGHRFGVGQMVGTMTTALGGILVGIGSSIVGFFDNTVLTSNGELTTFATWALAFLGIAFGLGVVKFITFLVKKN